MNVEGDFRYVESGAFEECAGFLDYLDSYGYEWEEAFLGWVAASEKWRQDQKTSQNYWDSWNLVKDRGRRGLLPDQSYCDLAVRWHVSWLGMLLYSRSMIGSFVMVASFLTMLPMVLKG